MVYVAVCCLGLPWVRWMQHREGRKIPFIGISFLYLIWVLVNGHLPSFDVITASTVAFAVWLIASLMWTNSKASLHDLLYWLACLILFTAARSVPVEVILWAVLTVGAILAGLQFYNQLIKRRLPVLGNSNHNAVVLNLSLFSGLWLAQGDTALLGVCLFIGVAVWFTLCRAGILALCSGLVIVSFEMSWLFGAFVALATVLIALGIFILFPVGKRQIFRFTDGGRILLYCSALRIIKQRPWFGSGLRMFQKLNQETLPHATGHRVHNDILEMVLEIGIIGLGLFIYLFSYIGFNTFSLAILIVFLVHAMFFFPLNEVHTAVPFWAIMGAVAGLNVSGGTWILTVTLVAVCIMVLLVTMTKGFGLAYFGAGGDNLINAVQCDPYNTEYLDELASRLRDKCPEESLKHMMVSLATHDGATKVEHGWQNLAAILQHNDKNLFIQWALKKAAHYKGT